jgi:tetratricopeptide (TPR) repeat protein
MSDVASHPYPRVVMCLQFLCFFTALMVSLAARAGAPELSFDAANKLYEQGQYAEAAARYEQLLKDGAAGDAILFNLGNAWFKAGQTGRAVAAWRQAERLSPRDPNVRFNLQFARKRVLGSDAPSLPLWHRALRALTLNEWTVLTSVLLWIWFLLLALREAKPALRRVLSGYTGIAGFGALLLAGCLAAAASVHFGDKPAVVIVPQAIARTGPLDEAKPIEQLRLRDGAEVTILDQKEVTSGDKKQNWIQIRDAASRTGWVKSDQLIRIFP